MRATVCALVTVLLVNTYVPADAAQDVSCAPAIDERTFASAKELRQLNATVAGFGLRTTGSIEHRLLIDWLEQRVRRMPGITTESRPLQIQGWQALTHDLATSALLSVAHQRIPTRIPIAGAIPYTEPTLNNGGELAYLPATEPITPANARGKVILRDFPPLDRGYLAEGILNQDLVDAGRAEAAGLIVAFDFPREQVRGYYDPHTGTHYRVPGVFVGREEALRLKQMVGARANLSIFAYEGPARTRSLIATLPGRSRERIVFDANTDGNTWVQENGNAGMLALADYFARQPLACRARTLEFVFATGHLNRPTEGTEFYARELDASYDSGTVAYAFAFEHLGTREFVAVDHRLVASGQSEFAAWFAGSPRLTEAAIGAITRRGLDRVAVLPGIDPPNPGRVPPQCSFGGLGTHFQSHLIPATAMISGPWSLWAPSFGENAIDFDRMRQQVLAAGDTVLALGEVSRADIAGPYLAFRQARAAGAPTCSHELPPVEAPLPRN